MIPPARGHVTYVFDAYCGWCYGFTPWLRQALAERPHLSVEVVSGGLFTGARRVPIREHSHIPTARHRVTEVTGAVFGPAFLDLLQHGDVVMDSHDAAAGLAALRTLAPDKTLDFAHDMSHAFYHDGLSLSDTATYRTLATRHNLDPDAAAAALTDPAHRHQADTDIARAHALGVTGYPTVFLDTGTGPLNSLGTSPHDLGRRLDSTLTLTRT
ncbi:DsbA family protein [Streptomyces sp. H27-C3]|uniref:DsbA family protein n=1 Tax=Streptomyces sp. H27-C3 TaxID=3046305 RepID=UPI0024BB4773|nr:DsbA family protein [Streptomyces sp. H27-C3]MDJ0466894.1 DsbA family protein [Streptomyces sp. H27-C3]